MRPRRYFITGTDTGVGKTRLSVGLCHAFRQQGLRVAAMKPIASGCVLTPCGLRNEDALALHAAMDVRAAYADVNPYAFEPAIAPHIAAAESQTDIDFEVLDRSFERLELQSDVIIVEGAGGWLTPLDQGRSFADLAVRWDLDVILVVGLRLGCLNHALLSAAAIQARGLRLAGWVGNTIDPHLAREQANLDTLHSRLAAPCLATLAFAPETTPPSLADAINLRLLPAA